MTSAETTSTIPTIDLSAIVQSEDPAVRKAKAIEFVEAVHVHGACGIVGHGISVERLREAFKWSEKFFNLPTEVKNKAPHPRVWCPIVDILASTPKSV